MTKQGAIKMQKILDKLGMPLSVAWELDDAKSMHGEIKQGTI